MDRTIHQGVRNLPTNEKSYAQNEDAPVSNLGSTVTLTFWTDCYGSYHWTSIKSWIRYYSHHCGPWLFPCSIILTLPNDYHRPQHCSVISMTSISLVWHPGSNYFGQRSTIYFSLQPKSYPGARDYKELVNGLSSTDRRTY